MSHPASRILVINGSIRGSDSNSGVLADRSVRRLQQQGLDATVLTLAGPMPAVEDVRQLLEAHDGFLVIFGVYWNNWSSALQRFLEVVSPFEHTPAFFGKPVACALTMDAVGGMEVAARLHAVFSGLGCWSPPCATVVLSRIGLAAVAATAGAADDPNEDVWRLSDLDVVLQNLVIAAGIRGAWQSWPHLPLQEVAGPWPEGGPLDLGSPRFLERG